MFNVYEMSISPGIQIEEAETEMRLKEKDGGAYHHHLIVPGCEPMSPKGAKTTFVNQCGYYVHENIPISFKLWKKSKATDNDNDTVPDTEKEMLWADVK